MLERNLRSGDMTELSLCHTHTHTHTHPPALRPLQKQQLGGNHCKLLSLAPPPPSQRTDLRGSFKWICVCVCVCVSLAFFFLPFLHMLVCLHGSVSFRVCVTIIVYPGKAFLLLLAMFACIFFPAVCIT